MTAKPVVEEKKKYVDPIAVPKLTGKATYLSQDGSFSEAGVGIKIVKQERKGDSRTRLFCHIPTGDGHREKENGGRTISEQYHLLVPQNQSHL